MSAGQLIDLLIAHWEHAWEQHSTYYLDSLIPMLQDGREVGTATEQDVFGRLRQILTDDEWKALPQLVVERREGRLRVTELERPQILAAEERRMAEAELAKLRGSVRLQLQQDFLGADRFFRDQCKGRMTVEEYENEKATFAQGWAKDVLGFDLDREQATVVAAVDGDILVEARAGSGKTRTLVCRAQFLQRNCGIAPDEMLLLAFNRKAAAEMAERLAKTLGDRVPHVMTFHALAYALVHPEENVLHDGPDEDEGQGLSRVIQRIIDDHLQVPRFKEKIRTLMLAHFREDWDRIVQGGYERSKEEFLKFRRSLPRESLAGEPVKSYGEKVIADFLFEHDLRYKYEKTYFWNKIPYRPDFTVFKAEKSGVIIEYFGLAGDADYDEMSDAKREYWRQKPEWKLIDFSPRDIASDGVEAFRQLLRERLESEGITCRRLSEDDIWDRIHDRAIDRFTKVSAGFVGRCRKAWITPDELDDLIERHAAPTSVETEFLEVARALYRAYLKRLVATGEEDFDGLMQRAVEVVRGGTTRFARKAGRGDLARLRYVFIDEFQDFSELFEALIGALRSQNPRLQLFCVGDDWQAINAFAGSDLKFFRQFESYAKNPRRLQIATNYRSGRAIVATGNALMAGLGTPAVPHLPTAGEALLADISEFTPSIREKELHSYPYITPIVLRLASKALADGLDVALLSRTNLIAWPVTFADGKKSASKGIERFQNHIRNYFPKEQQGRITVSTSHKFKGLECGMVVVLDGLIRAYPLIHPDWVFSRIFGESPAKIIEEERRLLYVALTRAEQQLVIVTDRDDKSPFLADIQRNVGIRAVNWAEFPPLRSKVQRLDVRVGNHQPVGGKGTHPIRDLLRACGYMWRETDWPAWVKSLPTEGFSIEVLQREMWAASAARVEVRILDDQGALIGKYRIESGTWICLKALEAS